MYNIVIAYAAMVHGCIRMKKTFAFLLLFLLLSVLLIAMKGDCIKNDFSTQLMLKLKVTLISVLFKRIYNAYMVGFKFWLTITSCFSFSFAVIIFCFFFSKAKTKQNQYTHLTLKRPSVELITYIFRIYKSTHAHLSGERERDKHTHPNAPSKNTDIFASSVWFFGSSNVTGINETHKKRWRIEYYTKKARITLKILLITQKCVKFFLHTHM